MPYTPTQWRSGDVITSEKLNKIEGGIASNGTLNVPIVSTGFGDTIIIQMSAGDLFQTCSNMSVNVIAGGAGNTSYTPISTWEQSDDFYIFSILGGNDERMFFVADAADKYPVFDASAPGGQETDSKKSMAIIQDVNGELQISAGYLRQLFDSEYDIRIQVQEGQVTYLRPINIVEYDGASSYIFYVQDSNEYTADSYEQFPHVLLLE